MSTSKTKKCEVCHLPASSRCSRCKVIAYDSEEHQKLLWKYHVTQCIYEVEGLNYVVQKDLVRIETDLDINVGYEITSKESRRPLDPKFTTNGEEGRVAYFQHQTLKLSKLTPLARQNYLVDRRVTVNLRYGQTPLYHPIRMNDVVAVMHTVSQLQDGLYQAKVPDSTSYEFVRSYFFYTALMRYTISSSNIGKGNLKDVKGWDDRYREEHVLHLKSISDKLEAGGERKIAVFRFGWIVLDLALKDTRIQDAYGEGRVSAQEMRRVTDENSKNRMKALDALQRLYSRC